MKLDKSLEKVKKIPWKPLAVILAISFICATIISMLAGYFLFPEGKASSDKNVASRLSLQVEQRTLSEEDLKAIMKRNLFQVEGGESFWHSDERVPVAELIKSTLPLKLAGTIYSGDPLNGIAMIKFKSKGRTGSFMNGDTIMDNAVLKEVHKEKIILNNNGQLEYVEIDKKELVRSRRKVSMRQMRKKYAAIAKGPAAKEFREEGFERNGSEISISKDYKAKLLGPEFTKVLQDAKASPNIVGGKLRGFSLNRIRENSIYQKSGLQNGDIVEEINGILLTDTAQAIKLLNSLRNESEIELRVVRGGKPINFVISMQ